MLVVLSACKFNQQEDPEKIITGIDGLQVPTSRDFSGTEVEIAKRICINVIKKREWIAGSFYPNQLKFKFNLELKSCEGTTPYYTGDFVAAISNVNPTYLEYHANKETYFRDVVTDQSVNMKPLCDHVLSYGQVKKNTMPMGNYILAYNVLINNGFDRVEISKQVKNDKGNWNLAGIETIEFISQKEQAETKFFGVEKERILKLKQNCGGEKFSSIKETWLQATSEL